MRNPFEINVNWLEMGVSRYRKRKKHNFKTLFNRLMYMIWSHYVKLICQSDGEKFFYESHVTAVLRTDHCSAWFYPSACLKQHLPSFWVSLSPSVTLSVFSFSFKVNEQLRDILIEEQKLREASLQVSNAATHKVRTQAVLLLEEVNLKTSLIAFLQRVDICGFEVLFKDHICLHKCISPPRRIQHSAQSSVNQLNRWAQSPAAENIWRESPHCCLRRQSIAQGRAGETGWRSEMRKEEGSWEMRGGKRVGDMAAVASMPRWQADTLLALWLCKLPVTQRVDPLAITRSSISRHPLLLTHPGSYSRSWSDHRSCQGNN